MHLRSLKWRIALPFAVLITLLVIGLSGYTSALLQRNYIQDTNDRLLAEARLVGQQLNPALLQPDQYDALMSSTQAQAEVLQARMTIIAADGVVLADSLEDPRKMENHLYRPEVQQAISSGQGYASRFSQTTGYNMLYVAVYIPESESSSVIVRLALPMSQVQAEVAKMRRNLALVALAALLAVVALAFVITQRTLKPIYRLTAAVKRMAAGDMNTIILSTEWDEVGQLTNAFNQLGESLRTTISSYEHERDRLAGLVEHLVDGVMILDSDGKVRLCNPAALRLLGYSGAYPLGASVAAVSSYPEIIALWRRCQESGQEASDLIELERAGIFCQAILTPLSGSETGSVLVILQDLTNVHRLETVRRDFISNISHELRTPLASLKMLAETLRNGALEDPPAAQHFVERIESEVDNLTQMVEELLELARIESGRVPLKLAPVDVSEVVLPVLERLMPIAEHGDVLLSAELYPDLPRIIADRERLQRALGNLVHNGIKFTQPGGWVRVTARSVGQELIIDVQDSGIGINPELLERIFERFYTADKSRSGGTGLGLAIARHIVQAHTGCIWVESTPGVGSTFHIALPLDDSANS
ncbi:MAG: cell wall metabolism sensor histidine kinase WalK [Chloroflexi bacterium]|nr:cell wall metabolism sensor histidine kinase WalK [Chloroflexota bacterium]